MNRGNTYPKCNESLLSFREFIKITNTNKSFYYENCGKELRLSNNYLILILVAVIMGLAVPVFLLEIGHAPSFFYDIPKTTGILSVFLYFLLWIIAVTYLAWRLVGWGEVDWSDKSQD